MPQSTDWKFLTSILIVLFVFAVEFCLPCPLLTLFPFVISIWLSSSCNSDFNSANLLLLFLTIEATSLSERRSVVTSRNFSAPSLIYDVLATWEKKIRTKEKKSILINLFDFRLNRASANSMTGTWHLTYILTLSSFRISRLIASLISSKRFGSALSGKLSVNPYLWLNSYKTGCFI